MLQHDFAPSDSVCLFFGQSDTHAPTFRDRKTGVEKINSHPSAGQPYRSIDAKGIVALLSAPAAKPKESASAIIPSRLISPLARNHALQHSEGRFIWSCYDIDKGNRSLDDVCNNFEAVFPGTTKLIYSSSSATADDKRWRVLMPMLEVSGADFQKIQKAAFELIEQKGLQLDEALARCGQPVYLPNVPPSKRDQDGKPFFYQYALIQAAKLDAKSHAGIQACIHRADQREKAMREEANAHRLRAESKRAERTKRYGQNQSPIDHFNETHPLEDLMLEYGYEHLGGPHYASPNSQSKGSAVRVWDGERWSSLTSGDAEIGQKGDVGTWGDAFDLFVHYEHQGDQTAALQAYALAAGLSSGPKMDNDFSDFEFENSDRGFEDAGEEKTANHSFQSKIFTPVDLMGKPIPTRDWHVGDMVPARTVTLLSGDGGTGKSLCALQLAVSTALARPWLGLVVKQGRAVYLSAEDDRDELHRRLSSIAEAENVNLSAIRHLQLASLAGEDALLVKLSQGSKLEKTSLYKAIEHVLDRERPVLLVLDTLADYFPGNENDRAQVRQFIGLLRHLAIRFECAVVLLGHPSLTGLGNGSGTSGSTAWNNSVRSRLYLKRIVNNGSEENPDARILTSMKSNYSRAGIEINLTWRNGVFVADAPPSRLDRMANNAKAERVFLKLLRQFDEQGRKVNDKGSTTYAPRVFCEHPDNEGCTKAAFKTAMECLLKSGRIQVFSEGPPSKPRSFLGFSDRANGGAL